MGIEAVGLAEVSGVFEGEEVAAVGWLWGGLVGGEAEDVAVAGEEEEGDEGEGCNEGFSPWRGCGERNHACEY